MNPAPNHPSQRTRRKRLAAEQHASAKAMFVVLLLAGCAHSQVPSESAPEAQTDAGLQTCGYLQNHDIFDRLRCLRARLEEMMMPSNSRLVSTASASAHRGYSGPQLRR
jgi:hypothetical protein